MANTPQSQQSGARIVGRGSETAAGPGPAIMAANTLEGNRVLSSDDEDLGKIKEVMLDVQHGRIAYATTQVHAYFHTTPHWQSDPLAHAKRIETGAACDEPLEPPEAGGVKL
ncbi:hypothetical protein F4827_003913 [Paraburkholderia bannensis]|uniref:PRC-barrel domain-containing protein n=1 Tax=Paraburkholderia bannensis TaxID=765414 RepID=A0A7W9WTX4_9BURK|nr:hypothetical protein [Paraburkholderia sp. WP4_3_2]MBB6104054.1 hypothetical protein [Paraburkholderia bannensis]